MPQQPSVAIIGAGPGGLTAANIFLRHGWQCQVFEADASANSRDQGGSLDLHPEEGQLAMQKAGLLEQFMAVARHEDQEQRIVDATTGALVREFLPAEGEAQRPEIDRDVLRQLLLQPLPAHMVHWNSRVLAVNKLPDGRVALHVDDNSVQTFDLVIGADGAWSKVRAALTDVTPIYTGVTFVELWLDDIDHKHPAAAALVGHGTMFALHDQAGIIAQRNGKGRLRVYAALRSQLADKTIGSKEELLARFSGWAPALTALLSQADQIVAVRPIVALPAQEKWPHQPGITLIGDAAHVMPPLGTGVNLAMLDAAELAIGLISGNDWCQTVRACEATMSDRAGKIASQCSEAFDEMFGQDAARTILDHFDDRHA